MSEVRSLSQEESPESPGEPRAPERADTMASDRAPARNSKAAGTPLKRGVLMVLVPALIAAAVLYAYLHSGRYVSTDNAYIQAEIVNIAAEVSGAITAVHVRENQRVAAGDKLFRLDERLFKIAAARAAAQMAQAETDINADRLAYRQALAELDLHRATAEFAQMQYVRQQGLREGNLGSVEDLDEAKYTLDAANRQIEVAREKAATLLARLNGDADAPVTAHPRHQAAQAQYDQALLDLAHAEVTAPFGGVVTNKPELGEFVERGVPVMSIVADEDMWVEANFKETQYAHVRVGQEVEVKVDSYPGFVWHGRVDSISEATGAEFALLPPQNATGNWVKIVQRIPLRVAIDPAADQPPLRVGMSSTVSVNTGYVRSWHDLLPNG